MCRPELQTREDEVQHGGGPRRAAPGPRQERGAQEAAATSGAGCSPGKGLPRTRVEKEVSPGKQEVTPAGPGAGRCQRCVNERTGHGPRSPDRTRSEVSSTQGSALTLCWCPRRHSLCDLQCAVSAPPGPAQPCQAPPPAGRPNKACVFSAPSCPVRSHWRFLGGQDRCRLPGSVMSSTHCWGQNLYMCISNKTRKRMPSAGSGGLRPVTPHCRSLCLEWAVAAVTPTTWDRSACGWQGIAVTFWKWTDPLSLLPSDLGQRPEQLCAGWTLT